jgi:hypothetical protein
MSIVSITFKQTKERREVSKGRGAVTKLDISLDGKDCWD